MTQQEKRIEYLEMYKQVPDLVGKQLKIWFITHNQKLSLVKVTLDKFEQKPTYGSVIFDVTMVDGLIRGDGTKTSQQDPAQSWEYKLEFGTSLFERLTKNNKFGVTQMCNSLWITYTNPMGLRSSMTALKVVNLEFIK